MTTKYKTFAEHYNSDPDFRKKHLAKMCEKVKCECGFVTARCNMSRHKKSHLHIEKMEKINKEKEIREKIENLKKEFKILEKTVNK
jgi:hypothetical protein